MTIETLPNVDAWLAIQDDLTAVTRKSTLLKLVNAERTAHGDTTINEDDTKNLVPNEVKAYHRMWRYEHGLGVGLDGTKKGENTDAGAEVEALRIEAIPFRQLGHDCFVGVIGYNDLKRLSVNSEAQRDVTKSRVPKIRQYVDQNDGYFGAAVVSIEGGAQYDETSKSLYVDADASILIGDGQHRWRGISEYLASDDVDVERLEDGLAVVIYVGLSTNEQRQMFADINANAMKPNRATMLNFNLRDLLVKFTKELVKTSPVFASRVNFLKTRIGVKDRELFTFSNLVDAIDAMFDDLDPSNYNEKLVEAVEYWSKVGEALESTWTMLDNEKKRAYPFSTSKNALVPIARLYGQDVDFEKLGRVDWEEISRIAGAAGGSNAAIAKVYEALRDEVVNTKEA